MQNKIHKLLLLLGNDDKNKDKSAKDDYEKQVSSVVECMITYIARLMRFVWTRDVSDLTPQTF